MVWRFLEWNRRAETQAAVGEGGLTAELVEPWSQGRNAALFCTRAFDWAVARAAASLLRSSISRCGASRSSSLTACAIAERARVQRVRRQNQLKARREHRTDQHHRRVPFFPARDQDHVGRHVDAGGGGASPLAIGKQGRPIHGGEGLDQIGVSQARGPGALVGDDDSIELVVVKGQENVADRVDPDGLAGRIRRAPFELLNLRRPLVQRLRIGRVDAAGLHGCRQAAPQRVLPILELVVSTGRMGIERECDRDDGEWSKSLHEASSVSWISPGAWHAVE